MTTEQMQTLRLNRNEPKLRLKMIQDLDLRPEEIIYLSRINQFEVTQ
jgi:hypothetical protein